MQTGDTTERKKKVENKDIKTINKQINMTEN